MPKAVPFALSPPGSRVLKHPLQVTSVLGMRHSPVPERKVCISV